MADAIATAYRKIFELQLLPSMKQSEEEGKPVDKFGVAIDERKEGGSGYS
jgi:hypothetical protein